MSAMGCSPAEAGVQLSKGPALRGWAPAFAGEPST
jgi:hypothetical protein